MSKKNENKSKDKNKICLTCLQEKDKSANFYKSYSQWHKDGLLPICKTCLKKFIKDREDNLPVVQELMRTLDKPLKVDTWKQAMESKKETLGEYLRIINLNAGEETYDSSDHLLDKKPVNTELTTINTEEIENGKYVDENKIYSRKWLGYYTPSEIEYLEDYINGLDRDFRIVTLSHKDYAKKIAKASLHMDKCFQEMQDGVNGADKKYREAKDVFDTLSKSAKFSESQRGITDVGMGSISQIVEMVESETYVYEHKNDLDKDNYDKLIDDFKHIYKSL